MPGFNICGTGEGPSATREIARRHRWSINVWTNQNANLGPILLYAQKGGRPRPEIDEVTIHHGQDEIYVPGKNRWGTVEFTFYEYLDGGGDAPARLLYDWWTKGDGKGVVDIERSRLGSVGFSGFKATVEYSLEDGFGGVIYKYILMGAWPSKISPSDLDYEVSGFADITVTLRYDKAIEEKGSFNDVPAFSGFVSPGEDRSDPINSGIPRG